MRVTESERPTSAADDRPSLEQLEGLAPLQRLVGRNTSKADVVFYQVEGRRIALKTYQPRPWWIRASVGRLLTRRETKAFLAATGVEGIPDFVGRLGPCALATEWLDARSLASLARTEVPGGVFDRLDAMLVRLHRRGVALADLHHRDVLVDRDGRVFLVDLATALVLGSRPAPFRRWLFARLCDQDRVAAARMRARYNGTDEAQAMTAVSTRASRWHGRGRRLKVMWDRLRGKRRR